MKIQKLEKKQIPQVIGLGVLAVVLLSVAGFQLLGARAGRDAQAQPADPKGDRVAVASAGQDRPGQGDARFVLPPLYHPDPFAAGGTPTAETPAETPAEHEHESASANAGNDTTIPSPPADLFPGGIAGLLPGGITGLFGMEPPPANGTPTPLPEPAGPQRPLLKLTGVIDGSPSLALVELPDNDRRILQVDDVLPNDYRVELIQMAGVTLIHKDGEDRWFVPVGYDHEESARKLQAATLPPR